MTWAYEGILIGAMLVGIWGPGGFLFPGVARMAGVALGLEITAYLLLSGTVS
jgi:hypothetical protein